MTRSSDRSQRGSTLLEFVIALVIIAATLGAILSVCAHHGKLRQADEELHLALCAARANLARARALPIADLVRLDGSGFDIPALDGSPGGLCAAQGDPDGLAGRFTVVNLDPRRNGEDSLYRLKAEVVWSGVFEHQVFDLETLVTARQ